MDTKKKTRTILVRMIFAGQEIGCFAVKDMETHRDFDHFMFCALKPDGIHSINKFTSSAGMCYITDEDIEIKTYEEVEQW